MHHFCTLFDSNFLPQGLALYSSLRKNVSKFNLWILCMDEDSYTILKKLNYEEIRLIRLDEVETYDLINIKSTRTRGEYCWTLTPFLPGFVFNLDEKIESVIYVDADIIFLKNPQAIFDEFNESNKQVLITEHSPHPENDHTKENGRFCVQFMIFKKNGGEIVRRWWEERCLEWCYSRHEDGKFGDQKYLDCWPELFPHLVHILQARNFAQGPWNASRYEFSSAIFYHFHSLRIKKGIIRKYSFEMGNYKIPTPTLLNIYLPYIEQLRVSISILKELGFEIKAQQNNSFGVLIKKIIRPLYKKIRSIYLIGTA